MVILGAPSDLQVLIDNFCVLLRRDGHSQLVYKHAISTIMPGAPVHLMDGEPADWVGTSRSQDRRAAITEHDKNGAAEEDDEALALAGPAEEVMVIGGSQLFEEVLPRADRLYLTWVHGEVEGDSYFPSFDLTEWKETSREERDADEKNRYALSFVSLARK